MNMVSFTKDEKYMLKVYNYLEEKEDFDLVLNRFEIGESIGFSKKTVNTIVTLLMQANFLKKQGKEEFNLTDQGIRLVKSLLDNK